MARPIEMAYRVRPITASWRQVKSTHVDSNEAPSVRLIRATSWMADPSRIQANRVTPFQIHPHRGESGHQSKAE